MYAGERTSKAVLNWVGTYHKKPFKQMKSSKSIVNLIEL